MTFAPTTSSLMHQKFVVIGVVDSLIRAFGGLGARS
ncbi:hypothetical protein EYZ11_005760 [Aspergillus tanneri]|uniref:Uncharacterized protein n=1 Tax=Aspergillus tanneri TaxID=1220188 RepID=A0A4S3JJN2_9EURO|nr:hypothetical protein EYZ11_005760 [Aspergillus tanneri]